MDEATMLGVLMRWALNDLHHIYVLPNSNQLYRWEADLITVTRSMMVHEFEVKISKADYKRDCLKHKHHYVGDVYSPNYFWYATSGFEIEPPEKWGWLSVEYDARKHGYFVHTKKPAPRLHQVKLQETKVKQICRMLSWRVANSTKANYREEE